MKLNALVVRSSVEGSLAVEKFHKGIVGHVLSGFDLLFPS